MNKKTNEPINNNGTIKTEQQEENDIMKPTTVDDNNSAAPKNSLIPFPSSADGQLSTGAEFTIASNAVLDARKAAEDACIPVDIIDQLLELPDTSETYQATQGLTMRILNTWGKSNEISKSDDPWMLLRFAKLYGRCLLSESETGLAERALACSERKFGDDSYDTITIANYLRQAYVSNGQLADARRISKRLMDYYGQDNPRAFWPAFDEAIYLTYEDEEEAVAMLKQAQACFAQGVPMGPAEFDHLLFELQEIAWARSALGSAAGEFTEEILQRMLRVLPIGGTAEAAGSLEFAAELTGDEELEAELSAAAKIIMETLAVAC